MYGASRSLVFTAQPDRADALKGKLHVPCFRRRADQIGSTNQSGYATLPQRRACFIACRLGKQHNADLRMHRLNCCKPVRVCNDGCGVILLEQNLSFWQGDY
ncbi:MAG: hypothetical protein JSY10_15820 [Paenibacillus sp.]|nr:hypothetical protein [Paenibacillus sp.]